MKPSSCASRSELALALVGALGFTGCAAAARPVPAEPAEAPPAATAPSSIVNIEFANGSAKASVAVDLSQTDVQLDMRTRARRDTAAPPRAAASPAASLPGASTEVRTQAATNPDSATRAVVAGIRRGQELFLKGDLAAAREAVLATLSLRPTAEAHSLAGSIAWVGGDAATAREHWRTSLRLDPAQPGVADILARTAPGPDAPDPGKVPPR